MNRLISFLLSLVTTWLDNYVIEVPGGFVDPMDGTFYSIE